MSHDDHMDYHGQAKAEETQAGLGMEAAGPEAQAALLLAQSAAEARLCMMCRHAKRMPLAPWDSADCKRPALPLNLVTGQRSFPCIIARGYDHLCGWQGRFWERK